MKVSELIIKLLEIDPTQSMDIVSHTYFGEGEVELSTGESEHTPKKIVVIIGDMSS